jgi:hypothetical protein
MKLPASGSKRVIAACPPLPFRVLRFSEAAQKGHGMRQRGALYG